MKFVGLSSTNFLVVLLFLWVSQTNFAFAENNSCKIKLGVLLPLTGGASLIGERAEQAASLAISQLDPELRERISLVFEDTEMKPATGFRGAQKLLSDPEVIGLTGFGSETLGASADFIERKRVPTIFCTPDRRPIKGKNYLFRHWVDGKDMREALSPLLNERGLKRIAIVHSELPALADFADELSANAEESGLEVIYRTNVLPSELDFRTVAAAAVKSKPDAIFFLHSFQFL